MTLRRWYIFIFWRTIILAVVYIWLLYKWDCKALNIPRKEILNRRLFQAQLTSSLILVNTTVNTPKRTTFFRQWEPSNTDSAIKEPFDCSEETILRWNIGSNTGGTFGDAHFFHYEPRLQQEKRSFWLLTNHSSRFSNRNALLFSDGYLRGHVFVVNRYPVMRKWNNSKQNVSVQFLGNTEVEAPKGTEVVKDAVRKLKFQRHIKKSEGQKTPKAELQISIYGVKILDPKTKDVQHNCQLHRISFCADDKTDKRIFTFICKDSESNKHLCYVFDSEKCAEEITLTIGQAFDLAYKKFLESGGKDVETRKQIGSLQKRIQELETENSELKQQLQDLEEQLMIAHVPPAGSISMKPQSTDVFDMVPFSPVTPLVPTVASNGCPPPPPTTLPPDIRERHVSDSKIDML
ncbi:hypothetical protein F2P81_020886 [Scophthalmus maximus]|uniref:PTB domain-containing engulfment adapter protein 1 n=1 Tax=Scophthalmus maximus TaxID=52904 RepID=A0A6A4S0U9_SCOMX|nr:hypothetical protein F2P81_020886 [Scophthalmus maximus]